MNPEKLPDDSGSAGNVQHIALIRSLAAAWNARDVPAFLSFLDPDICWYDPAMPAPPARGVDEVGAFAESVICAFPDFRYEIHDLFSSPGSARHAVRFRMTGTNTGFFNPPGFAPTGQRVDFEGVDVIEIRDGRVGRITTYFDVLAVLDQALALRVRPPIGSVRERLGVRLQRFRAWRLRKRVRQAP